MTVVETVLEVSNVVVVVAVELVAVVVEGTNVVAVVFVACAVASAVYPVSAE